MTTRIAQEAWLYIETVARPFVLAGGRLWTKTLGFSGTNPASRLRRMLQPLDQLTPATFTTVAAMEPGAVLEREHVMPLKRIAIEMIDPMQGDPRCRSDRVLIGRAESPEDVLRIYRELAVISVVTKAEHAKLNSAHPSSKWDAWEGDWRQRYARAGIEVIPIQPIPRRPTRVIPSPSDGSGT